MRKLFSMPLGVSNTPFGAFKCSAGAIDAFGSAFGSMLGLALQESQVNRTNELNWKIAQDNLFAAEKLNTMNLDAQRENWKREQANFEQQREWSLQDRAYENWYNSPAQQKLRYQQAGFNPALMMQGQSAASSVQANQGQAPSFSSPSTPIPERNDFQYTPMDYEGLGTGINQLVAIHQAMRNEERQDYALASQILFGQQKATTDFMNARAALKKAGVDDRALVQADNHFQQTMKFETDKWNSQVATDNARLELEGVRLAIEKSSVDIQRKLAESKINVDNATCNKIATEMFVMREDVQEMKRNGASQRAINDYISKKEQVLYQMLGRENSREGRLDREGARRNYRDFTEWLLSPLKGIISVGIK